MRRASQQDKFRRALQGRSIESVELTRGVENDWLTLKLRNSSGKLEQVRIHSTSIGNNMCIEVVRRKPSLPKVTPETVGRDAFKGIFDEDT